MAAVAGPVRGLHYLCSVLFFFWQFCILLGDESTEIPPYVMKCPSNGLCSRLPADCVDCATNFSCVYGKPVTFDCTVKPSVTCVDQDFKSQRNFIINMTCRFCWQLPETDYECSNSTSCMTVSCPRQRYLANCTVWDHIHCLGNRTFPKMLYCNWTGGYKWSTALALRCDHPRGAEGLRRWRKGPRAKQLGQPPEAGKSEGTDLQTLQREHSPPRPCLESRKTCWTWDLQDGKIINLCHCCFKTLNMWQLVTA
ncbi:TM2 domain-containing protein 3 isoform X1 [Microcebus murinus]|uniref:TM2 domain-containing protein 3 isoform X1 n=1 Tax=Microcebus murinus TaxID=30608 RepID=UPI003F6B867A